MGEEPKTHLGASSRHGYCTDYEFNKNQNNGPLKMFGRDEICPDITWLDVKNCRGSLYEDTFNNLPNLQILNFTSCFFENINGAFKNLSKLSSIDIWKSNMPFSKSTFEGCDKISNLRVINSPDIEINDEVFKMLKSLENLTIQRNHFSVTDDTFSVLQSLKYFCLYGCTIDFKSLTPFKGLEKLTFLGINGCILKNLKTESLFDLKQLEILHMMNNDFGEMTFDFESLKTLPNLETIAFPMSVLEQLNYSDFKSLKTVQADTDFEISDSFIQMLTEKNVSFESCSSGELPDFDEKDPRIQICA